MINFIIKLSKSTNLAIGNKYNSILIIIDKLIKYSHIIACKKKFIAKQLRYIILNRLIRYYDIFKRLTSNKDKLFTSNYWKTLLLMLETRLLNRANKLESRAISKILRQQYLQQLSITSIYDSINIKCKDFEYY